MSSDDEDSCAHFGASLPQLDASTAGVRKRPVAAEDQIVTDEKGRRRFHGAFTGGFSAGFFNTVDTPQGFRPAQFKSSRGTRQDFSSQRPEDFMDDEDLGDFGIAPQSWQTNSKFQKKGRAEERSSQRAAPPAPSAAPPSLGPAVGELLQLSKSTVGEELLMRQGWRPGQGIGAKMSYKSKRRLRTLHGESFKGSRNGGGEDNEEDNDEMMERYKDFLFSPDEVPMFVVQPKENLFGIGYKGLDKGGGARYGGGGGNGSAALRASMGRNKKFSIAGQAFGVGVYEEDDADIYERQSMSQYDTTLDVSAATGRDDEMQTNSSRRPTRGTVFDGVSCLEGFRPAAKTSFIKTHYPPPAIPRGWTPTVKPARKETPTATTVTDENQPSGFGKNPSDNLSGRQFALDKEGYIAATKNRLLSQQQQREKERQEPAKPPNVSQQGSSVKQEKSEDRQVTSSTQRVLEFQASLEPQPSPVPVAMTSRFVSAGVMGQMEQSGIVTAVAKKEEDTTMSDAADMKFFGRLTRTRVDWHPARLLCVRFNVSQPHVGEGESAGGGGADKRKAKRNHTALFSNMESVLRSGQLGRQQPAIKQEPDAGVQSPDAEPAAEAANPAAGQNSEVKKEPDEDDDTGPLARAPMDLFKAIFAESSDDSSDDEGGDGSEEKGTNETRGAEPAEQARTVKRPAAEGLFAGIDFAVLNRTGGKKPEAASARDESASRTNEQKPVRGRTRWGDEPKAKPPSSSDESSGEYGPLLPPVRRPPGGRTVVHREEPVVISSDDSDSSDNERRREKKSKKKKDKKKKKKHKKESKKEHKKHKKKKSRHTDSDS